MIWVACCGVGKNLLTGCSEFARTITETAETTAAGPKPRCSAGHFLDAALQDSVQDSATVPTSLVCASCPDGQYQDEDGHSTESCIPWLLCYAEQGQVERTRPTQTQQRVCLSAPGAQGLFQGVQPPPSMLMAVKHPSSIGFRSISTSTV
eukprot:gene15833-9412_t